MLRHTLFWLTLSHSVVLSTANYAFAREAEPSVIEEILPSALANAGQTVQVRAFDVAPDGSAVAVLYASWGSSPHPIGAELWVAMWEISPNKLAWKQRVATDSLSGAAEIHDAKDVIFTADQGHLLVLAVGAVWSIDAKSIGTPVSISRPADVSGPPVQIRAVSGAAAAITYAQNQSHSFYTVLIDTSSGKRITGWAVPFIPQSFSPDGKLAIAVTSGQETVDRIANLQVIDTATGTTLLTVPVGGGFKRRPYESVSAIARFLDNTHAVVAPDHMIDHPGKAAAYGLEFVDVSEGQRIREITPRFFRPTGELAASNSGNRFVAYSVYASERDFRLDSPRPKNLRINLFIFSKDSTVPDAAIPNLYIRLPGGRGEPLRLSSDGSVLGVCQSSSESIKVFQLKP